MSYQDGVLTDLWLLRTHGEFIVLPHWENGPLMARPINAAHKPISRLYYVIRPALKYPLVQYTVLKQSICIVKFYCIYMVYNLLCWYLNWSSYCLFLTQRQSKTRRQALKSFGHPVWLSGYVRYLLVEAEIWTLFNMAMAKYQILISHWFLRYQFLLHFIAPRERRASPLRHLISGHNNISKTPVRVRTMKLVIRSVMWPKDFA